MSDARYRTYTRGAGGRAGAPTPPLNLQLCLKQLDIFVSGRYLNRAHLAAPPPPSPSPPPSPLCLMAASLVINCYARD